MKQRSDHIDAAGNGRPRPTAPPLLDWGTHLCQLYQTEDDLVQVLVPYFAAGIIANEQCLWITSDPLTAEAATQALAKQVPDLPARMARGQVEIIDHGKWYTLTGTMELEAVVSSWLQREERALDSGYRGLRISGNTSWLTADDWHDFCRYEACVHSTFADRRIIALCSYSLDKCHSHEVVDVMRNHAFALIRKNEAWEALHNATATLDWLNGQSNTRSSPVDGVPTQRWTGTATNNWLSAASAHEHLRRLQRVTAALSPAATVADIGHVVVHDMAAALEAEMAVLAVPINDGEELMLIDHAGLLQETSERFGRFPVETELPVAKVFRQGVSEWLPNPQSIADEFPDLPKALIRSKAIGCAPLIVGRQRLGAVGFGYTAPQTLTPERHALLDDLAKQVAFALERARLYEDTRRTRDRLQLLSDVAVRLATGQLDLGEVLETLCFEVTRYLADACAISLVNEHSNMMEVAALRHVDPVTEQELSRLAMTSPVEVGHGISGRVAASGEAVLLPRIESEVLAALKPEHLEFLTRHPLRSVVAVPLRVSGTVIGVLSAARFANAAPFVADDQGLLQDIADRAALAIDNARLYAKAQEASQRKDEFLAVLGHELRNPLSPIVTALELMKLRGDTQSQREREVIARQVMHVNRLVDDLLDVSRVTRGLIELRKERATIDELIERALEMAGPLIEQRGHHVSVQTSSALYVVDVDRVRIGQVLVNLLANAARYTPPGGTIDVRWVRRGHWVELAVRDSGIGISQDALNTIFEPFVQVERSLEGSQGGLGLGLALVKSLVELHGGQVQATSDGTGKGSEFMLTLPLI